MRLFLKLILWGAGLIAAVFIGVFIYGMILAATGNYAPPPEAKVSNPVEGQPANLPKSMPTAFDKTNDLTGPTDDDLETMRAIVDWLRVQDMIFSNGNQIYFRTEPFRQLSSEDALAIYRALESVENAKSYAALRVLFFAACANLNVNERKDFLERSGAVFPPTVLSARRRDGDFTALLTLQADPDYQEQASRAITAYAPLLSDKEIIYALTEFGVIEVYRKSSNLNAPTHWRLHSYDKLYDFKPQALLAINSAIKDTVLGDRRELKKQISALAHKSPGLQTPPSQTLSSQQEDQP